MPETESIAGRCECEVLRYQLKAPPLFTHACHCLDCQNRTGESFSITVFVLLDDLIITHGEILATKVSARSTTYTCVKCQTLIYICSTAFPSSVILKPGTLDDPGVATPQAHIWVCRKQAGLVLPRDIPQFKKLYEREVTWPQDSLSRLKAAG